jgi:5'-methylthioadenosine phosphorylase
MTGLPEAKLAREAEMSYATLAMVTDYDCWRDDIAAVEVHDILSVVRSNAEKAARLLSRLMSEFSAEHLPCPIGSDRALDYALVTARDAWDPALVAKLDVILARKLGAG